MFGGHPSPRLSIGQIGPDRGQEIARKGRALLPPSAINWLNRPSVILTVPPHCAYCLPASHKSSSIRVPRAGWRARGELHEMWEVSANMFRPLTPNL
ncbi:hypothetical protein RRG08_043543 [Elysia crispata]|uniref:Uncharacterized protein n=1 Tax=Elysia crispata TaxID=231223 RepID=A0AAE0YFD2_9GAST|nr:hypothetical protein RRG08_043543 [Elysia crispata]